MHDKPAYLTREGLEKLENELRYLCEVRRPQVAERIRASKEFSDVTDNADFEEAKNEQGFIEGRILTLQNIISRAQLIDGNHSHDSVTLGAKVAVVSEDNKQDSFTIVGSAEASPRTGKISNESPVGRALLGHKIGDLVEVSVPAGTIRYTIIGIE
ncbi:MAG: transcription elongation factor GreA [Chloroflexi bacterium]|nr:transcription elongation factor GreA [Chloroflexota bacterium]